MVLCDGKAHTPAGDSYLLAGFFFGDTDGKESGGADYASMEQLQDEGRIALRDEPVSQENFEIASPAIYERNGYLFIKRSFDIVTSLFLAVFLMIPMVIVALLIRMDSPEALVR